MPRHGPQRPTTAPQLRLDLTRVLGDPDKPRFTTSPSQSTFESEEAMNAWFDKEKELGNWRVGEKRLTDSKRKRLQKPGKALLLREHDDPDAVTFEATPPSDASNPANDASVQPAAPPVKKVRVATYEWTEKWICDHAGKPRDQRQVDLSPRKRRPERHHESIKVGCKACIWFRKRVGATSIELEYKWEHTGHEAGSLKDMRESMMSDRVRDWVNTRIDEGLNWNAIKDLIRIDEAVLDEVR